MKFLAKLLGFLSGDNSAERRKAYEEGILAAKNGAEITDNPHCHGHSSVVAFQGWFAGWTKGKGGEFEGK